MPRAGWPRPEGRRPKCFGGVRDPAAEHREASPRGFASEIVMSKVAELLERKQRLLGRLREQPHSTQLNRIESETPCTNRSAPLKQVPRRGRGRLFRFPRRETDRSAQSTARKPRDPSSALRGGELINSHRWHRSRAVRSWTRIAQAYPPERAITALTERSPSFFASMGEQASSLLWRGRGSSQPFQKSRRSVDDVPDFRYLHSRDMAVAARQVLR